MVISILPTDGTASGFVLSYADLTTGSTRSVVAHSTSTCELLVFIGIVLDCGTFNITVTNDALCCASSSSASTSASTASSDAITTGCCPDNSVPRRLYAVVSSATGNCNTTQLMGVTLFLLYDAALPNWTWTGVYDYGFGGYQTQFVLRCNPTLGAASNVWSLTLVGTGNPGVVCSGDIVEAVSARCSPSLSLLFRVPIAGNCCTGAFYIEVFPA